MTPATNFAAALRVQDVVRNSLRPATRPSPDLVSLASGEPDFDTPEHIRQALIDAVLAGKTHYAAWNGDPELREALAAHAGGPGRPARQVDGVLVTHGGSAAIASAILATVNPGDRVIIPTPTYSLYADLVRLAGGRPDTVPQTGDLHLDLESIEAVAPGARMVVVCNPCNPTGAVYDRSELAALGELAERHGLLVMCDEAYEHIVYEPGTFTSVLDIPELAERVLYVQTFSKTYAMTGWRVGYLVAPPEIVSAAAVVHRSLAGPLNTAVQRAALAAVTGDQAPVERMLEEYRRRRGIVVELLKGQPGARLSAPAGTFYGFIGHAEHITSVALAGLARDRGVAIRPGSEFGPEGEGYVRISFANDEETLTKGLLLLRDVLAEAHRGRL